MDEEILAKLRKAATIGAFFALALVFFLMGWYTALKIYVVVIGLFTTLAILIQSGKGGGLAASLGGLGGESLLGVRSATPIAKATYVMLGLFIFICVLMDIMGPQQRKAPGLLERQLPAQAPVTLPELPALGETPASQPSGAAPAQSPPAENAPAPSAPAGTETTQPEGAP